MTQKQLTVFNLGQSLDDLMNLDPRGYGVCKILYTASRERAGEPVCAHAAKFIQNHVKRGDYVYLMTGFVLRPFGSAETDGIIGTMFLARALYMAYGVKPVIICQEENVVAVQGLSKLLGFHVHTSVEKMGDMPFSFACYPFTKNVEEAKAQAQRIFQKAKPSLLLTIEAPGANEVGVYHNAIGLEVNKFEAKMDVLFDYVKEQGVPTLAIGDLGNEIGMGGLQPYLDCFIPYAGKGGCSCGCNGGIAVRTAADCILTATVSDWGCYALCAMIAYLSGDLEIMHDGDLEAKAMQRAADCGMIDMYGQTIPAIDGIGLEMTKSIVTCMRECVRYSLKLEKTCEKWFEKTLEKGFFDKKE